MSIKYLALRECRSGKTPRGILVAFGPGAAEGAKEYSEGQSIVVGGPFNGTLVAESVKTLAEMLAATPPTV